MVEDDMRAGSDIYNDEERQHAPLVLGHAVLTRAN